MEIRTCIKCESLLSANEGKNYGGVWVCDEWSFCIKEQDLFLNIAIGNKPECDNCGTTFPERCDCDMVLIGSGNEPINFYTWEGFGALWEWSKKQDWWQGFIDDIDCWISPSDDACCPDLAIIDPRIFANTVYELLKEKQNGRNGM